MYHFSQPRELFEFLSTKRCQGLTVGLVPTMGAIHQGHLSIFEHARKECDIVVVSIFVNPLQFNNEDDFLRYPRDLEADEKLLESAGVDVLFAPLVGDIHPSPLRFRISATEIMSGLEGKFRTGHFEGVALVVAKLFVIVGACVAYFGEKDFQQLRIISDMVRELHFPVQIRPIPTVREENGLAISSRNVLLSDGARAAAPSIYEAFKLGCSAAAKGESPVDVLPQMSNLILLRASENGTSAVIDYLEAVNGSLEPVSNFDSMSRFFCAVSFDGVRLIDNTPVFP